VRIEYAIPKEHWVDGCNPLLTGIGSHILVDGKSYVVSSVEYGTMGGNTVYVTETWCDMGRVT
jgi:hypothetical protein